MYLALLWPHLWLGIVIGLGLLTICAIIYSSVKYRTGYSSGVRSEFGELSPGHQERLDDITGKVEAAISQGDEDVEQLKKDIKG